MQKADVLNHIRQHGSITRMEAFETLGVCELSSRILELEKDGHEFTRQWQEGRAKNGRKWRVVRYGLVRNADGSLPLVNRITFPGSKSPTFFA